MANEFEDLGFYAFRDELRHQEEERHARVDEFQMRYAERKQQKDDRRRDMEWVAMEICRIVKETVAQHEAELTPEDLHFLAGAISSAATALNTLEQYAEYIPMYSGMMGIAV